MILIDRLKRQVGSRAASLKGTTGSGHATIIWFQLLCRLRPTVSDIFGLLLTLDGRWNTFHKVFGFSSPKPVIQITLITFTLLSPKLVITTSNPVFRPPVPPPLLPVQPATQPPPTRRIFLPWRKSDPPLPPSYWHGFQISSDTAIEIPKSKACCLCCLLLIAYCRHRPYQLCVRPARVLMNFSIGALSRPST